MIADLFADGCAAALPGDRRTLTLQLVHIARAAGQAILVHYGCPGPVERKGDDSPVTVADREAEAMILAELERIAPGVPVVAEESVSLGRVPAIPDGSCFFLVDPLDGTKEFLTGNGEFTVNIALVEGKRPTLGVVHLPALGQTYWTDGTTGAWRRGSCGNADRVVCREAPSDGICVVASRSHRDPETDEYIARFRVSKIVSAGSSLKFCRVAEGAADLYPRFGRTMEWDTAAGHAVLVAAGGRIETRDGQPLNYGKATFENPAFIARGSSGAHPLPPKS